MCVVASETRHHHRLSIGSIVAIGIFEKQDIGALATRLHRDRQRFPRDVQAFGEDLNAIDGSIVSVSSRILIRSRPGPGSRPGIFETLGHIDSTTIIEGIATGS